MRVCSPPPPGLPETPEIYYSLEILVSDVAELDEVWPQAVDPPVGLPVVFHLRPQVPLGAVLCGRPLGRRPGHLSRGKRPPSYDPLTGSPAACLWSSR